MNITIDTTSAEAILCPLDGRRPAKELLVKIFTVNLTTLAFFVHFIKRRDGTAFSWTPLLFFVAPMNLVFRHAFALVGIFGAYLFYALRHFIKTQQLLAPGRIVASPLRLLFGRSRYHDEYDLLPTDEAGNLDQPAAKLSVGGAAGRMVINGAFITQCAGSIFLYHRRRQRNAVAILDDKVFHSACGGLVVGVLNLALSLRLPLFADFVREDGPRAWLDRYALFWRDSCRQQLSPWGTKEVNGTGLHWIRFLKNFFLTLLVLWSLGDKNFDNAWRNLASGVAEKWERGRVEMYLLLGMFFILCAPLAWAMPFLTIEAIRFA
jgi:hypothetical protein